MNGFNPDVRVVHREFGEGRLICTIDNRAVVQFEEDGQFRNVFSNELRKVEVPHE